jgi:LPS-assembly lipoprotein
MNQSARLSRRQWLSRSLSAAGVATLAGCGFELRKAPHYAFQTFYTNLPENSPIGAKLTRNLQAAGVEIIRSSKQIERAQVIFEQLLDQRDRLIIARTATGAIREFQLRLIYRFKLHTLDGKDLIPAGEISLLRDVNYNESQALSADAQSALLYADMESDLIQQLLRRLAAVQEI